MTPSAVLCHDADAVTMLRGDRMLALRSLHVSEDRCGVHKREVAQTSGLHSFVRQKHRPIKDALTCSSLGCETMMPSLHASVNLTAGMQYSVTVISDHRECFLALNGTHVGSVRLLNPVNQDRPSRCKMTPSAVLCHDADAVKVPSGTCMLALHCFKTPKTAVTFLNEKWTRLRGCILARHKHLPINGTLNSTSLGCETMIPTLLASLNLTVGMQYSVTVIPDHYEWFLARTAHMWDLFVHEIQFIKIGAPDAQ